MTPTDLSPILDESAKLSERLPAVKNYPSSGAIKDEIALRKRQRIILKQAKSERRKVIAEEQGWIRVLEIADDKLAADIAELEDVKWERIHDEREAGKPHGVTSHHDSNAA